MFTLLIVFISVFLAGLGFWFYNKRQVNTLVDQIDDKNAVINALRNHVDESTDVVTPTTTTIEKSVNLTPSVEEAIGNKQKKNNGYYKKNGNKKSSNKPKPVQFEQSSEKKNRPKPRKKNKPTE